MPFHNPIRRGRLLVMDSCLSRVNVERGWETGETFKIQSTHQPTFKTPIFVYYYSEFQRNPEFRFRPSSFIVVVVVAYQSQTVQPITWHSHLPCAILDFFMVVVSVNARWKIYAQITYKSTHHSRYSHTKRCRAFFERAFGEMPRIYRETYHEIYLIAYRELSIKQATYRL